MTTALTLPLRTLISGAWLTVIGATVLAAVGLSAILGQPTTTTINAAADVPAVPAAATTGEPWVPGVMTFSGERTPTQRLPILFDELDPNCLCIGFY